MEDNKNKQNTLLLTVIAVATLLVAVIGATFAYFTANVSNSNTSTVQVTGAELTISYEGTSAAINATGKEPSLTTIGTKTFTLTGKNTTTDMSMPYLLYLVVGKNEFVLDNAKYANGTSLSYVLTSSTGAGAIPSSVEGSTTTYGAIPTTLSVDTTAGTYVKDSNTITYSHNTDPGYDHLSGLTYSAVTANAYTPYRSGVTIDDGNGTTANQTGLNAVLIGRGFFGPNTTSATHTYTLDVYFLEDNKNQDEDKSKSFYGYIAVSAGDQAIASSVTAVNCAKTPNDILCTKTGA